MFKLSLKSFVFCFALVFLLASCSNGITNSVESPQPSPVSPTATAPEPAPTQVPMDWPSEKTYFAVYDPQIQRVVLIGRENDTPDVWAYDTSSQTLTRLKDRPLVTINCAVYDSKAGGVIANNQVTGKTWFFQPQQDEWNEVAASKAGGWSDMLNQCPIAYDAESARTILIAGVDADGRFKLVTQTYHSEADLWEEMNTEQPVPPFNFGGVMVYDDESDLTIYWDAVVVKRVWSFDTNSSSWKEIPYSGGLDKGGGFGAMVYVPDSDHIYVYYLNQFYTYDTNTNTWELAEGELLPGSRTMQAMAYDPLAKKIVVYGGVDANGTPLDDLWLYDPQSGNWTEQPRP